MVPKKPPAKTLPEAKDVSYVVAIEGGLYLIDADALKGYDPLNPEEKGLHAEGPVPEYLIVDIRPSTAASSSQRQAPELRVHKIVNAELTGGKTIPASRASTGVEAKVLDQTILRATEVLGNRDEAMRWLGTPVRALDYATPISISGTKEGIDRVNHVLGQMEYGIW